ncbi:hypothetical protein HBI56_056010 [Parastagonospora nodorum]|uniref:Gfd2/YDR514C-like C-terminal domain-containing protein n=1 Tax=Phaeosphaeria nodorum (strain SN15 / ATCC MYA-4574 / FGSC 10173) TaxID=321614 RepID=A0A7U2IC80_PHANO|nr:hypothetical protein HBH56_096100 [Parastagonospora nodorum]QRD07212.1 hypothetical protein JI435_124170 [Parastagonospora nodorum SN15]KAH3930574.1 hypothetical protein HBH54_110420 [Parastagonospora nodorum]KAH3945124.1 hypothetical protein HBH53_149020 [Parastagonospora nodorum]KAH3966838.1 hypothetical protein HBH51_140410 [Parastagonospora nodorum]
MVDFPKLADNMIVVCFGTESWVRDHDKLTEIGIATFDLRDMRTFKSPGMHGDSLLKQVYFYHARIEENAHVINIKYCPGDLDSNCFGQTRFANSSDATKMLESIFKWSFDAEYPELGFCPVIVMGHALSGDLAMLSRTLGVHAAVFDTVVSIIDTQQLCRETCSWTYHNLANLQKLVSEANFHYRDTHTACNDAAMTLICAVHMVLPSELKTNASGNSTDGGPRTRQDVVDEIEEASQYQDWSWGTASAAVDEPMFLATQIRPHAVPRCSTTTVVPPRLRTTGKLRVVMRRRTVSSLQCVVPR